MKNNLRILALVLFLCSFISPSYAQCGGNVICASQCVPKNSLPALLHGRARVNSGNSPSDGGEGEEVQWERSYDNVYWVELSGATAADYQPEVCNRTTYYRRTSYHYLYRTFLGWDYDFYVAQWYISNVVTIIPTPLPAPSPNQSEFLTCGGTVTTALVPLAGASTYNWWVPYAGWGVSNNGSSPFSTFNANSSFVTPNTSVVVTLPAGVPAGVYPIYASANSACGGGQSADATLYIRVDYTPTASPVTTFFVPGSGSTNCLPTYDVETRPVAGGTNYIATLSTGETVYGFLDPSTNDILFQFRKRGPATVTATVTVTSNCGSASYTTPPYTLNGPGQGCGPIPDEPYVERQLATGIYPNPAADQVVLQGLEKDAQVTFYDSQGIARMSVKVPEQNAKIPVNLLELPNGLYFVRTTKNGKMVSEKQLVVQH